MYVTSPPASTIEPPATVANALEGPDHHLDPSILIAVAWESLSPPQLDTSAATEAHQRARRRREHNRGRNRGDSPRRPSMPTPGVHGPRLKEEGWTRSTMDPVLGPWTMNLRPP